MIIASMPLTRPHHNFTKTFDWDTSPIFERICEDRAATACASKLIEKTLLSTVFGSDNVWAHLSIIALIGGYNLLLVYNCFPNGIILGTFHCLTPLFVLFRLTSDSTDLHITLNLPRSPEIPALSLLIVLFLNTPILPANPRLRESLPCRMSSRWHGPLGRVLKYKFCLPQTFKCTIQDTPLCFTIFSHRATPRRFAQSGQPFGSVGFS